MVRQYRRQLGARKYHDFSEENLQLALDAIKKKEMSLRKAAEMYGVPKSTTDRKISGKNTKKYGHSCVLSLNDKTVLAHSLLLAADWGFPMSEFDVRLLVKRYLDKVGMQDPRFKNNMPGVDWVNRQCDQLKVRFSENINAFF